MSDTSLPEQLISALLDGQLTGEEKERAEGLLAQDPALREKYESWKLNSEQIANLPRYQLSKNFADQVMAVAESRKQSVPVTAASMMPATPAPSRPG